MKKAPAHNAEARAKVAAALVKIESAQNELVRACQELSPVIGLAPTWRRVGKLSEKCKAEWYRLDALRRDKGNALDLDGMHKTEGDTR